ncbi:MAG: Omp28 family outer membrane lipoprotein [Dysgonamonadaceae bacterium]|jgi:hypothetical protein|nr:Omp28 family outer membrane lipoprotein [Dysgonamonadaceae bacterium]
MSYSKITLFCLSVFLPFFFIGCDVISEDNRKITIEQDSIIGKDSVFVKRVLLLDFTDQSCPNCPKAGAVVEQLKQTYDTLFIPVTIHASRNNLPLVTPEGNVYDIHFGFRTAGHPASVIDGRFDSSFSNNFYLWSGIVSEQLKQTAVLGIYLSLEYDAENREIHISSDLLARQTLNNPKLLVWIIEDNVIDKQLVDATIISDYHHRHIFRASVNEAWGEAVDLPVDQTKTVKYNYTLNEKWKTQDISIIVFVYNADTDEVYGVNEIKLSE